MVKKYQGFDICVLCKKIDFKQRERLEELCPVYVHKGEDVFCKTIITNYDTSILDYVKSGDAYMVVHADYTQNCYSVMPNFKHPKLKKVLGITQYICDTVKEKFGVDCELCHNPLFIEPIKKRIVLVSATRLSAIKGGVRMKKLAEEMDLQGLNYIWYVFTNDNDCIGSGNVVFLPPRLDVIKWIAEADYLVQLSDTEACSYSINEALSYGTKVIVTPLPYLEEFNIKDGNALILDFDMGNVKDVVKHIRKGNRVKWEMPQDKYNKYLVQGKSNYVVRRKSMKRIRVKQKFLDMKHNNVLRKVGFEFVEDNERAEDLISRGFCVFIEDIEDKKHKKIDVVETGVKEEKKEKAVKEKAVRKNAKK